jgi:nitrite reductase (cytochrome c-552)
MKSINQLVSKKPWLGWVLFLGTMMVVFFMGLLASTIVERRAEAVFAYTPIVEFEEWEPRNEIWGKNFPREYESWLLTSDTTYRSKYMGSATIDFLEEYPSLVMLWAGYAFSWDYKQSRGHYYAIHDLYHSLRVGAPVDGEKSNQPNTCWTCKSPDVPRLMKEMGVKEFYSGTWETLGHQVVNPIGCADCHDANNMNLIISRPALVEAYERMGKDITKVSHQDMRSLTCAQCHVEYYFDKSKYEGVSYLVFPWDKGLSMEDMEAYYDEIGFTDWTHAISKAPMLKAQHPDYELFMKGVHYKRGISCADCHMPFHSQGGVKYSSHHAVSPLKYAHQTCQVCHREDTEQLIADVYERQDKIMESRVILEDLLVKAHVEAGFAWDNGASEVQMDKALKLIRAAQWRWDFVAASHGGSFHAPLECSRILAEGIHKAHEARLELNNIHHSLGVAGKVVYPDISTKAKAQKFIGLDMDKRRADKQKFLDEVVPQWGKMAEDRQSKWNVKNL